MTTNETLESLLTLLAVLALLSPVVYLLERTHRRTSVDVGDRRVREELRFRATDEAPARDTATAPVPKLRGRRHVWVSAPR